MGPISRWAITMTPSSSQFLALFALLCALISAPLHAGRNEGIEAYSRQDWSAAYREFKPLADANDPVAQYFLASMYFNGWGVKPNDLQMVRLFKASAESGVAMSQFLYGILHMLGQRGVQKNEAVGVQWIRLAAEQGVLEAMDHVGTFYRKGTVYDPNLIEACSWYETASLLGYSPSSGKCMKIAKENRFTEAQIAMTLEIARSRAQKIKALK
jgi:uncharacterized protein